LATTADIRHPFPKPTPLEFSGGAFVGDEAAKKIK
jgi:hypothetical protein